MMGGGVVCIYRGQMSFPFLFSARFYRGVSGLVQRYGAGNGPGVG